MHVSNFRPVKNCQLMAQMFVRIRRAMDAELWLVGDGQDVAAVRGILHSAGMDKDVKFWGRRNDLPELLSRQRV